MEDHSCILIVEDEPLVAEGLREVMDELDLGTCQVAQSVDEAVRTALKHNPLLIIMDLQLRGIGDGVDAAIEIHNHLDCPIIFTTGNTAPSALLRIFDDRPSSILKKPYSVVELKQALRLALRQAAEANDDRTAEIRPQEPTGE
jgi:two-component system, response regulator PdtaR